MATWIAYSRAAENILNKGFSFDKIPFVVGNIGPDAGMSNEDWSQFSPPDEMRKKWTCLLIKHLQILWTNLSQLSEV